MIELNSNYAVLASSARDFIFLTKPEVSALGKLLST